MTIGEGQGGQKSQKIDDVFYERPHTKGKKPESYMILIEIYLIPAPRVLYDSLAFL